VRARIEESLPIDQTIGGASRLDRLYWVPRSRWSEVPWSYAGNNTQCLARQVAFSPANGLPTDLRAALTHVRRRGRPHAPTNVHGRRESSCTRHDAVHLASPEALQRRARHPAARQVLWQVRPQLSAASRAQTKCCSTFSSIELSSRVERRRD
jgi:hypothetical protein